MKYIDAEKLIAEIEKRIIEHRKSLKKDITSISEATLKGSLCAYKSIEHFIDSLQQEQLEVDLEKAAQHVYESWMGGTMDDVRRDMVELGKVLNARKEN